MRNLQYLFANRCLREEQLPAFGFTKNRNGFKYETEIMNGAFKVIIQIKDKEITSQVMDSKTQEEYILGDLKTTLGEYASKVKDEYETILANFQNKCSFIEVFKTPQVLALIKYVKTKYKADLEFLWEKYDAAIWRNQKNQKWYGLLMQIEGSKLGLKTEEKIEIIDLRYPSDKIYEIIDNEHIFPGYHMNKKHWITIILDGRVASLKIEKLLDNSYNMSDAK